MWKVMLPTISAQQSAWVCRAVVALGWQHRGTPCPAPVCPGGRCKWDLFGEWRITGWDLQISQPQVVTLVPQLVPAAELSLPFWDLAAPVPLAAQLAAQLPLSWHCYPDFLLPSSFLSRLSGPAVFRAGSTNPFSSSPWDKTSGRCSWNQDRNDSSSAVTVPILKSLQSIFCMVNLSI